VRPCTAAPLCGDPGGVVFQCPPTLRVAMPSMVRSGCTVSTQPYIRPEVEEGDGPADGGGGEEVEVEVVYGCTVSEQADTGPYGEVIEEVTVYGCTMSTQSDDSGPYLAAPTIPLHCDSQYERHQNAEINFWVRPGARDHPCHVCVVCIKVIVCWCTVSEQSHDTPWPYTRVPITRVWGNNTLHVESAPGRGRACQMLPATSSNAY
jgi:hypothetical protein